MDPSRIAKLLGSRGGQARARRLPAAERRRIAAMGGNARRRSMQVARDLLDNLKYADIVLELQGGPPAVRRMKTFEGPLPGIYRRKG